MLHTVPTLADLVTDTTRVNDVPVEAIASLRAELAKLDTLLLTRLFRTASNGHAPDKDRLLTADEAAKKLGFSVDYLYRHSKAKDDDSGGFPFVVRVGRSLKYSETGIEKFIRSRSGR